MTVRPWLALALMCATTSLNATSVRQWHRDDVLENPRWTSVSGRYVLVIREYPPVGDFASVRVDSVVDFDAEDGFTLPHDGDPRTQIGALYDGRRLASVIKIAEHHSEVMVSDSGKRIIVAGYWEPGTYRVPSEPFLTIYDAGGAMIRTFEPSDVFTAADIEALRRNRHRLEMSLQSDGSEGEVIAISLDKFATIRIRTSDGTLLDEPRDHLPVPRAYASATKEPAPRERVEVTAEDDCFEGLARIASSQLFARAIERSDPVFPLIAMRANIRGRVWVEVVVSESGYVICARATRLPFGLQQAALAAARHWKFTPYEIGGRRVSVTSEIVFHFEDLTPLQWEELQRSLR